MTVAGGELDSFFYRVAGGILLLGLVAHPIFAQQAVFDSTARSQLATVVNETIEDETFAGGWWGLRVTNLETGNVLYARNVTRNFTPASNMKLLTAAAALDRLGPDYRYETTIYADGPVRNGTLEGNLIIRGSGDPTLGGYEQRKDPTQVLRQWADSLREWGIQSVEGDIIGDDDPFSDEPMGVGWNWDWVPRSYAAEPSGLIFNGNTIDLAVAGRRPGESAWVSWEPLQTDFVRVHNRSRTVPYDSSTDSSIERQLGTNQFEVASEVHPSDQDTTSVTITEPTRYVAHVTREVFLEQGITVEGRAVDVDDLPIKPDYEGSTLWPVATYRSPPLRDIVQTMNRESQNLYAEQLLRTMAVENPPDTTDEDLTEGSIELGVLAIESTLAKAGVDTSRVQLVGGSGLSRKNLVTPCAVSTVLEFMWDEAEPDSRLAFYQSLPTGGREGTLKYRFRGGSPARGNVRAKTGTLSNVSALSGYVRTQEDIPLAFVIFSNHHTAEGSDVRRAQDTIVNALVDLQ